MTLYVDASAFVKRYVPGEPDHDECIGLMQARAAWTTSRVTLVEAPRGVALRAGDEAAAVLASLDVDLSETTLVDIDHGVLGLARGIALETGVRTLDAIHLASAKRIPDAELEFLTYDARQARAAEQVGLRLARTSG